MMNVKNVVVVGMLLLAVACGGGKKETTTPEGGGAAAGGEKTLFERLGGLEAVTAVIDEFLKNVAADERINARFASADLPGLRQKLIDQVCQATGGPCEYKGKNMVEAHTGMNLTEDEFNALVEDLVKALDKFNVPQKEKDELLGALGGMKGDIVGK